MRYKITNNSAIHRHIIGALAALCVALCTMLTGCLPRTQPIQSGTYVGSCSDNSTISKIQLIIRSIDEETFTQAQGINVLQEYRSSRDIRYFSFHLSVYVDELGDYQPITITGVKQEKGAPQVFYLKPDATQDNWGIKNISFFYDDPAIVFYCDGCEYRYWLSLVE